MYGGMFDGIAYVFYGLLIAAILGIGSCTYTVVSSPDEDDVIPAIGNSIENMENLKRDCEKSLPRDKVCVMVFDYIPVENDYEQ